MPEAGYCINPAAANAIPVGHAGLAIMQPRDPGEARKRWGQRRHSRA